MKAKKHNVTECTLRTDVGSDPSCSWLARCVSPQGMCLPEVTAALGIMLSLCLNGWIWKPLSSGAENIPPPAHLWETNSESTGRWPKLVYEFCRDCSAQFSRDGSQCIQHQISLFVLEGELLTSQKFRFWDLYLPQSWKPEVPLGLWCAGRLFEKPNWQHLSWVMETRLKEEQVVLQELPTINPKWSLQTGLGAWGSEWRDRSLGEGGTLQEVSVPYNPHACPEWELFSAFTHAMWAYAILPHSCSVTNPFMPAEGKNEPSIIISIIHSTEDFTRNVTVSENLISFKVRK